MANLVFLTQAILSVLQYFVLTEQKIAVIFWSIVLGYLLWVFNVAKTMGITINGAPGFLAADILMPPCYKAF